MTTHRLRRLLGSSAPRLLSRTLFLAAALFVGASSADAQTTWHVQYDQEPGNPLTGHPNYSQTIGWALALASPGDTILVHEDWYSEDWSATNGLNTPPDGSDPLLTTYSEDLTFPAFDITIKADLLFTGRPKVIEIRGTGTDSVVTFNSPGNTRASLIEGFTITGGTGGTDNWQNDSAVLVGGGIKCLGATPTIKNCTIKGNSALLGGGIYASVGSVAGEPGGNPLSGPLILNCVVDGNTAKQTTQPLNRVPTGGGIMSINCSPEIDSTVVSWNTSEHFGGGVAFSNQDMVGNPLMSVVRPITRDSVIRDNTAAIQGGGFYIFQNLNPKITRTKIKFNTAGGTGAAVGEGGGLFWVFSQVELDTCHINGNRADLAGGGIFYEGETDQGLGDPLVSIAGSTITHCTIERNVTIDSGTSFGGGIRGQLGQDQDVATTRFENCLIASNSADNGGGAYFTYTKVFFQNCTISQNLAWGTGGSQYVGGVYFSNEFGDFATVTLQDTILHGNRSATAVPTSAWWVDFRDLSIVTFPFVASTFVNCMMLTATLHPQFAPGIGFGNLSVRPVFANGWASTYFPNGGFYLAHAPQQPGTSPAYNAGSQVIGLQLAVNGMTCRTVGSIADAGKVDMGFHYPVLPTP